MAVGVQAFILIAGMVDDFKTRKVHNWLVLSLAAIALAANFWLAGVGGLKLGLYSMLIAFSLSLPLVIPKIMGAGDMKLLMALALISEPMSIVWTVIYSFVWGALLGVIQVVLKREGTQLINNLVGVVTRTKQVDDSSLHKIPYTVALFFGWLTHLSLTGWGGLL